MDFKRFLKKCPGRITALIITIKRRWIQTSSSDSEQRCWLSCLLTRVPADIYSWLVCSLNELHAHLFRSASVGRSCTLSKDTTPITFLCQQHARDAWNRSIFWFKSSHPPQRPKPFFVPDSFCCVKKGVGAERPSELQNVKRSLFGKMAFSNDW